MYYFFIFGSPIPELKYSHNISLQTGFYAENEENFLFHINFIILSFFLVQYDWNCQVEAIFD